MKCVDRNKKAKSGSKHNFSDGTSDNLRQNGDAESSAAEPEQRQDPGIKYLKNPIVWIDLEMTGTMALLGTDANDIPS